MLSLLAIILSLTTIILFFVRVSSLSVVDSNGETSSAIAFKEYHHALLSSIHSNRTDYEWIFDSMRTFLAQMNISNFANNYTMSRTGKLISKEII